MPFPPQGGNPFGTLIDTGEMNVSAAVAALLAAADNPAVRALLDLEVGTDFLSPAAIAAAYQALDADLTAIAALVSAADKAPYATGAGAWSLMDMKAALRSLGAAASMGALLMLTQGQGSVLLGEIAAADFNSTADQAIPILAGVSKWVPVVVRFSDVSTSLGGSSAAGGVWSAAGKTGDEIIPAATTYTSLTAATVVKATNAQAASQAKYYTGSNAYFSLGTPHGSAATARVQLFGAVLG